ncbi:LysM peptidoglycan-binding domain-containing protein [Robiginitomaculum antarcticum]|uniref:LysM peptidoglycan-binding domain-containing protein n=1 Tax=Robiginitomaculum antarcticum TaxID=437507 RepID=UPI00036A17E8|nr:LysM domain-containing protein [Robiginitomaculum antarcticum]
MSQRLYFTGLTCAALAVLALGSCATAQENPQYKFSSRVDGTQTSNVQLANTAPSATAPSTQRQIGTAPAHTSAQNTGTMPTPSQQGQWAPQSYDNRLAGGYNSGAAATAMVETGGQNGGQNGALLEVIVPQSAAVQAPQTIGMTSQPTKIYMANSQAAQPGYVTTQMGVPVTGLMSYIVQEDDTVYNLSKRTCSTPDQIKTMNNLDAAYTIRAGSAITLPAPRC